MESLFDVKEFKVKLVCGDVYINGEFVSQLCFSADAVGIAVANWISLHNDDVCYTEDE